MTDTIVRRAGEPLNVARLVRTVQAIGWPYLALYVFLILLSIAANTLSAARPACDDRRAAAGGRHSTAARTGEPVERPSLRVCCEE